MPRIVDIELIDDILLEYGLDKLRNIYLDGKIEELFNTPAFEASQEATVASKITTLLRVTTR